MLKRIADRPVLRDAAMLFPGPLFARELRAASRRPSTYAARCAYVGGLVLLAAFLWKVDWSASWRTAAFLSVMSAESARQATTAIAWFQFAILPVVALAAVGTALSAEVSRRRLGTLLSTPLGSGRVVWGVFLAALCQPFVLAGITFVVLMVVRVLGGVPAEFVVGSAAVTLTTMLLAAAAAFAVALVFREIHTVIGVSLGAAAILFAVVPWARGAFASVWGTPPAVAWHASPTEVLVGLANLVWYPGTAPAVPWGAHCLGAAAAAMAVVSVCAFRIRKTALRRAFDAAGATAPFEARVPLLGWMRRIAERAAPRRVGAMPTYWLERLRGGYRRRLWHAAFAGGGVAALVAARAAAADEFFRGPGAVRTTLLLAVLGALFTVIEGAGGIAAEKQAGTWPLVCATPLSAKRMVLGRWLGTCRGALFAWCPFALHIVLCVAGGGLSIEIVALAGLVAAGIVLCFTASGLFMSAWCATPGVAIVRNVILWCALWWVVPFIADKTWPDGLRYYVPHITAYTHSLRALEEAAIIASKESVRGSSPLFLGLRRLDLDVLEIVGMNAVVFFVHALGGLGFCAMAAARVRE
ncbi:MAG TPA: hypothetical protein DCM87_03645 [Planctomycetes bacterium]|nr:hypothetical protein [Planctomycetota bacterium]